MAHDLTSCSNEELAVNGLSLKFADMGRMGIHAVPETYIAVVRLDTRFIAYGRAGNVKSGTRLSQTIGLDMECN